MSRCVLARLGPGLVVASMSLMSLLLAPSPSAVAADVYYDFEGSTEMAVDKLTTDGAQNGVLENRVSIQSENAPFGSQAAQFEIPFAETIPPYSTFEVPGTTLLGDDFTIALHVSNVGMPDFTRIFSNWGGSGAVGPTRMLLDYDPGGSITNAIRFVLNNTVVQTASPPPGMADQGFHHFAVSVDSGLVRIYFDGAEVASGNVGTGYSQAVNLRIGEDPHDLGGSADEQLIGHVDELLVIGRALDASDIAALATTEVDAVVSPLPGELAVYWDFEGDLRDGFTADGSQDGFGHGSSSVVAPGHFGAGMGALDFPQTVPPTAPPYSTLEIPGTTGLGEDFTIALHVRNDESPNDFTRLVSSFGGTGVVGPTRLLLDYDASGGVIPGLRFILNNTVVQTASTPAGLSTPGYHHFAVSVDSGLVRLYVDGAEVAFGNVGTGYSQAVNLRVGEDPHDLGGSADEQLIGGVDEVLVIGRTLSGPEILGLAASPVSSVVTPAQGELAIYYDFEGDLGDRFTADGQQDAIPRQDARLDGSPSDARLGTGSVELAFPTPQVFSRIAIGEIGNLGSAFTLSATFDSPRAGYDANVFSRLFSTYDPDDSLSGRLLLYYATDPFRGIGIRLILPDGTIVTAPDPVPLNTQHTLTATYDAGDVRLYLDGSEVASGSTSGDVDLGSFPLFVGEDAAGNVDGNFIGRLDDVLILGQALTPVEVEAVHGYGAGTIVPEPKTALLLWIGVWAIAFLASRRESRRGVRV